MRKQCEFRGCLHFVHSRGLCSGHDRQRRHGFALTPLRKRVQWVDGPCTFSGCENRRSRSNGGPGGLLCSSHSRQLKRDGALSSIRHRERIQPGAACAVRDCERPIKAGGLCSAHYQQKRDGKDFGPVRNRSDGSCRIEGCDGKHNAHGLCRDHYTVWRMHGIAAEEFERLYRAQGGVCAICGLECKSRRRLSVDHDHDTGRIRGLLCAKCNRGIGLLGDSAAGVEAALRYLRA